MSGNRLNPNLKELRKPWADLVKTENIMYSGHLFLMTSLYGMLFDDDEFEKDDSIVFIWDPTFCVMGNEVFKYSNRTLQKAILDQMEKEHRIGVYCEPNLVFVICNQFPLIAIRHNDVRDGTRCIDEVVRKYLAAWEEKGGMTGDSGFVRDSWMTRQQRSVDATEWAFSAWNNAFMHTWNADFVENIWQEQALGALVQVGYTAEHGNASARYVIILPEVATEYRRLVNESGARADMRTTQTEAVACAKSKIAERGRRGLQLPGEVAHDAFTSVPEYADSNLSPTWQQGGLFYPRNNTAFDDDMNWIFVSPYDGNAAIAYSRLDVVNGQRTMWDNPWSSEGLRQRPYIDGITLEDGVDFLRKSFNEAENIPFLTLRIWDGSAKEVSMTAKNLTAGKWELWVGQSLVKTVDVNDEGELAIALSVGDDLVNVVLKLV